MRQSVDLAWVLDGYNVLFQTPLAIAKAGGEIDLEASRRRLVAFLALLASHRGASETAVVFDSKQMNSAAPQITEVTPSLWVIFASHLDEADPYIEELIATHRRPKSLTVVTGDRKIRSTARSHAAKCLDGEEWFDDSLRRLSGVDLSWIDSGGLPSDTADGAAHRRPPPPPTSAPIDWPDARRRASRLLDGEPFDDLGSV